MGHEHWLAALYAAVGSGKDDGIAGSPAHLQLFVGLGVPLAQLGAQPPCVPLSPGKLRRALLDPGLIHGRHDRAPFHEGNGLL